MGTVSGIVVYILLWWWVFFMTLPFGVKRAEVVEEGHDIAAPQKPHLWKKVAATTIIAIVLWLGVDALIAADIFSFRRMAQDY